MASAYWHPFADMAAVPGHELVIARGEGVYLWDDNGKRYLDGTASLWHAHIGHAREEMVEAIARQLRTLEAFHTFGDVVNAPTLELVDRLVQLSPMADPRVFLCLGGGDAIDSAAKLARQHWAAKGQPDRIHLISRTFAYHGTHGFGTSLVGMESMRQGYGPLLGSVSHVDHQSPEALEAEIERVGPANVAAFFCEPVIGAGGVRPAPEGYIEAVAAICKRHGVLLVIDSVICAFGRVGTWFGYERWDIEPDMVVLAKGITSGYLPLGAVVIGGAVAEPFWDHPGGPMFRHGATYAGSSDLLRGRTREHRHPRARGTGRAWTRARGRAGRRPLAARRPSRVWRGPRWTRPGSRRRPHAGGTGECARSHGALFGRHPRGGRPAALAGDRRGDRAAAHRSSARTWTRSRPPSAPGSTPSRPPSALRVYRQGSPSSHAGARHGRRPADDAPPQAARADRA